MVLSVLRQKWLCKVQIGCQQIGCACAKELTHPGLSKSCSWRFISRLPCFACFRLISTYSELQNCQFVHYNRLKIRLQVLMRPGNFVLRPFMLGSLKLKPAMHPNQISNTERLGWAPSSEQNLTKRSIPLLRTAQQTHAHLCLNMLMCCEAGTLTTFLLRFATSNADMDGTSIMLRVVSHTFQYDEEIKKALQVVRQLA